ncbi:hypothetical protein A3L02_06480 [Thermococcus celer Vu 13 = JCM 8558]|uniref:Uncharacterized protein n=1 Tax=Thermococcus celer Vu 13 = JCM 8558 TaxID=1293037 RepID=A0A218P2U2_THECE|nr:hypothetical protein A3L02_06480 [Thermococcus celer Vu 13 = JCM 8558]
MKSAGGKVVILFLGNFEACLLLKGLFNLEFAVNVPLVAGLLLDSAPSERGRILNPLNLVILILNSEFNGRLRVQTLTGGQLKGITIFFASLQRLLRKRPSHYRSNILADGGSIINFDLQKVMG